MGFCRYGFRNFYHKTQNFSKIIVYPHGQEEREDVVTVPHLADKDEGGQFYAILCG